VRDVRPLRRALAAQTVDVPRTDAEAHGQIRDNSVITRSVSDNPDIFFSEDRTRALRAAKPNLSAVRNPVGCVFERGLPRQVGEAVVPRVSVSVSSFMAIGRRRAMKRPANETMHQKSAAPAWAAQANLQVAASATLACFHHRSSGEVVNSNVPPYAAETAYRIVGKAFNRSPNLFVFHSLSNGRKRGFSQAGGWR
jgi:hypothetical protein